MYLPLQQVTLPREEPAAGRLWDALWAWWTERAAHLYPTSRTYDVGWLEGVFRTRAVTVILDGVDDFLVNHPTMGLSYVVDTLRGAVGRYRDNPGFAVVASVRSGLHGLERLASNPPDVVEVLRLSVAQAERTFPTCRRWLARVSDLRVLDLVLTPLILSSFEPECDRAGRNGLGKQENPVGTEVGPDTNSRAASDNL